MGFCFSGAQMFLDIAVSNQLLLPRQNAETEHPACHQLLHPYLSCLEIDS